MLAATRWAACGVDATTVDYRLSANGLSADLDEMLAGWSAMLERIRALQPLTVAEAEPAARALFERYLARRALRTGQSGALALRHLATAVSQDWVALLVFGAKRSLLTLCGAIAATFLPNALIRLVVAR